jgi:hypothetical protein
MPLKFLLAVRKFRLALVAILALFPVLTSPVRAAEIARSPWQAQGGPNCAAGACRIYFPQVAPNRRLDIEFVSCYFEIGNTFSMGQVFLVANGPNLGFPKHSLRSETRAVTGTVDAIEISQPLLYSSTLASGRISFSSFTPGFLFSGIARYPASWSSCSEPHATPGHSGSAG